MALPSPYLLPLAALAVLLFISGAPPSISFQSSTSISVRSRNKSGTPASLFGHSTSTSRSMGIGSSSSRSSNGLTDSTKQTFKEKSVLLTGASRGLGKSMAYALSSCEPSLLILSGRDEIALKEVREECIQLAPSSTQVEIVVCDLSDNTSVENLANKALDSSSGVIDVLINNGGISSRSSFLETKLDVDQKLMQVNFFSGIILAKKLIPQMVTNKGSNGGGKVIWISSIQGKCTYRYSLSISYDILFCLHFTHLKRTIDA